MAFLGQEEQIREYQDRFRYLYAILITTLLILLGRLVYLQILLGDKMRQYSEENRIRRVKIASPRGMILDRNRTILVDNHPAFDLEIIPQYLWKSQKTKEVITLLSRIIKMGESEIITLLERAKTQPSFLPIKIKTNLTRDEIAEIETWKLDMPGVQVQEEIKRTSLYGDIASHLLGYIGEVSSTELPVLNKLKFPIPYKLGDSTGKFGLEKLFETDLRGVDGEKILEVDALGRIKLGSSKGRVLEGLLEKPSIPGKNLVLTIDQDLQIAGAKAFGDKAGSLVALDPKTGEILAMLSRPAFDSTEFSRGIPPTLWNRLLANENRPLRDKAIQDHYSPGSVFKIVTAIAGLEEGVIDEKTQFHCSGVIRVGNRSYHCHKKHGHGNMNIISAITQSCDIFFYRVAQKLNSVDDIAKWAFHFGLGKKTGIGLAGEVPGLIPTEEWKRKHLNQPWNTGETLSVAIGQSFVLTSALQLANMYSAIANGGTLHLPYFVKTIETNEGQVIKEFKSTMIGESRLSPKTLKLIKQGLWGVTNSPHGTAYWQKLPGMDFVGKTGTVQVIRISADKIHQKCENMRYRDRHNALFVGFAPAKDPAIVVAVIAEHACHGSSAAAPVVRAVIKTYLEKYFPDRFGEKVLAKRYPGLPPQSPSPPINEFEDLVDLEEFEESPQPTSVQPPRFPFLSPQDKTEVHSP